MRTFGGSGESLPALLREIAESHILGWEFDDCAAAGLSAAEDGITPSTSGTAAFGLLGDLMGAWGFVSAASRYLHACDEVSCPQCGCEFAFAERWWGMLNPRRSVFEVFGS